MQDAVSDGPKQRFAMFISRLALGLGAGALLAACGQASPPASPEEAIAQRLPAQRESLVQPSGAYSSIYSFQDKPDGQNPEARPIAFGGDLYGTTTMGGKGCEGKGCGAVFKITLDGKETVIHRFTGPPNDGSDPTAELLAVKQTLYGTTYLGGLECGTRKTKTGCGTVFEVAASGDEEVLYRFGGKRDGLHPAGPLTLANGKLYGTTLNGGAFCPDDLRDGCGTIFSIDATGKERILYRFATRADGALPSGNLIYLNGQLYGTTQGGGSWDRGCIFAISLAGQETVLYSFGPVTTDAQEPSGLVSMNGVLYGTTAYGGKHGSGAIYAVTTSGSERLLYSFNQSNERDGYYPDGRLIAVNGVLYGTTLDGGSGQNSGDGVIYSIKPSSNAYHVLYRFKGPPDGATPYAGITNTKTAFYGTTAYGGTGCYHYGCQGGYGTVFRIPH